jgi:RNA polymerase sigma-70 factor (ECF subfamily)
MGSELEFEKVYAAYKPMIVRYLTRLVGESEAEDLSQEVFIKVDRSIKAFRGDSQVSTWIYRIATNAALDRLRSPSFQRAEGNGSPEAEREESWAEGKTPSVETTLIRAEMNTCVREVVDTLQENYRTVVVLSELEGVPNSEIAEIIGISIDAVKIRLHRARKKLKSELEAKCDFYHDEQYALACDSSSVPK